MSDWAISVQRGCCCPGLYARCRMNRNHWSDTEDLAVTSHDNICAEILHDLQINLREIWLTLYWWIPGLFTKRKRAIIMAFCGVCPAKLIIKIWIWIFGTRLAVTLLNILRTILRFPKLNLNYLRPDPIRLVNRHGGGTCADNECTFRPYCNNMG